ncbi:MAG: 50S ribosome-binding GTPase [Cellulomonadaceae bacterium]|jgi:GTP-binding protein EngB required for normal cell division|nr:50S ribosome-binding GTPase [Cellulomonadaceae bacterium]
MSDVDLYTRTNALEAAVRESDGRLDADLADEARALVQRVRERGGVCADHTVVALAGSTGSGKSSLMNALTGQDIAAPGITRPTTSHALAAVWGDGADPLLDWLDVPQRRLVEAGGRVVTQGSGQPGTQRGSQPIPAQIPQDLVLLDLPDHDSVMEDNRLRAERLVERADLLVFVVDPQKYADAAIHELFLRPLAGRSDVVVVALNQVDRLPAQDATAMRDDLARLVAEDGLRGAKVLAVSAKTGQGIDALRNLLTEAAKRRYAATARLTADEKEMASRIVDAVGPEFTAKSQNKAKQPLVMALEDATGVPIVVDAVKKSAVKDARAATGWPVTRWLGKFRPDPLRRIGLKDVSLPDGRTDLVRSSLPAANPALQAAASSAVRHYVDAVTGAIPDGWVLAARRRVQENLGGLPDALDQAVSGTVITAGRKPLWWRVVNVLQWVIFGAMAAGLLWLGIDFALTYFQVRPLPAVTVGIAGEAIPLPTVLALGGAALGVLVALACRVFSAMGATRRGTSVRKQLRNAVSEVAEDRICQPVMDELGALARTRAAARIAAG